MSKKLKSEGRRRFANSLRILRIKKDWLQKDLCREYERLTHERLPVSTLSSYELANKEPSIDRLIIFARLFDVSTLLGEDDTENILRKLEKAKDKLTAAGNKT